MKTIYHPTTAYHARKGSFSTIKCKGAALDPCIGWIDDRYRIAVAEHILANHCRELTFFEQEVCELYQEGFSAGSNVHVMDTLVITFGHELK
jgi:hypothetical protein